MAGASPASMTRFGAGGRVGAEARGLWEEGHRSAVPWWAIDAGGTAWPLKSMRVSGPFIIGSFRSVNA